MKCFALITITLFLLTITAFGQGTNGTIQGHVVDSTGAIILGAEVSVTGADGKIKMAKTDQNGDFRVSVVPGKYTVKVVNTGFALYENSEVEVTSGKGTSLDVMLDVAISAIRTAI